MKRIKAFSLIESCFSLMIVGLFLSTSVLLNKAITKKSRLSLTRMRANYIRKNIEGYVARHGFLPYAAKDLGGREFDGMCEGYLPYITLGIDKSYAYDGYGKPFSFKVNKNLVLKYQKELGYIIRPPFLAEALYVTKGRSWGRLFVYKTSAKHCVIHPVEPHNPLQIYLYDYDEVQEEFNIKILKKNKSLVLTNIYVYPIVNTKTLIEHKKQNFTQFRKYRFFYPVSDIVAWSLSVGSGDSAMKVFWQSRFNLASQINYPITSCFTYIGDEQAAFIKPSFKYLVKEKIAGSHD